MYACICICIIKRLKLKYQIVYFSTYIQIYRRVDYSGSTEYIYAGVLLLEGSLDLLDDGFLLDFREVGGLELDTDADESTAEVQLAGGVEHLALDSGGVRRPEDEDELVSVAAVLAGVGKVENSISALFLGELVDELGEGGSGSAGLVDNDLSVVVRDSEDDVSVSVAKLELVEGADSAIVNANSRSH